MAESCCYYQSCDINFTSTQCQSYERKSVLQSMHDIEVYQLPGADEVCGDVMVAGQCHTCYCCRPQHAFDYLPYPYDCRPLLKKSKCLHQAYLLQGHPNPLQRKTELCHNILEESPIGIQRTTSNCQDHFQENPCLRTRIRHQDHHIGLHIALKIMRKPQYFQ